MFVIEGDILMPEAEAKKYYKDHLNSASAHRGGLYQVSDNYVRNIKVYIKPDVPLDWATATRQAIREWNLMANVKVNFIETTDYATKNIVIPTNFVPNGKLIAVGFFPYNDGKPGELVTINTWYNTLPAKTKLGTMVHEMGHTIGIFEA